MFVNNVRDATCSMHAKLNIFAFLSKKTQYIFDISTRLKTFLCNCACFSGDAPAKICTRMSIH